MLSLSDLRYLAIIVVLAVLPLPPELVQAALYAQLAAQLLLIGLCLVSTPLFWVGLLQDVIPILAVLLAKASWQGEGLFAWGGPGAVGWTVGILAQAIYLRQILQHTRAHREMEQEGRLRLQSARQAIEEDLQLQLREEEESNRLILEVEDKQQRLQAICRLGSQSAGVAILSLGCLLLSSPSANLWLGWALTLSLGAFLNSKAQDVLLMPLVPPERRLC